MQDLLSDIGIPFCTGGNSPFNDFSGKSRLLGSPILTYLYPADADCINFCSSLWYHFLSSG